MNSPFRKFKNQSSSQQSFSDKKRAFLKRKPIYFFVEMHSSFITAVRERQYLYFKSSKDVYNIHCIYKVTKRFGVILFIPRFCVGFFRKQNVCTSKYLLNEIYVGFSRIFASVLRSYNLFY